MGSRNFLKNYSPSISLSLGTLQKKRSCEKHSFRRKGSGLKLQSFNMAEKFDVFNGVSIQPERLEGGEVL